MRDICSPDWYVNAILNPVRHECVDGVLPYSEAAMARPHRVQVYRATNGRWYWRRLAGNHRVVAASEQGFRTRRYCTRDAHRDTPQGCEYTLTVIDAPE